MNENNGNILIELYGKDISKYEAILQNAVHVLQQHHISYLIEKKSEQVNNSIKITMIDIGMIDRPMMTEFLETLFPRKHGIPDSVSINLYHEQKIFTLPDEIRECEDWFHIE